MSLPVRLSSKDPQPLPPGPTPSCCSPSGCAPPSLLSPPEDHWWLMNMSMSYLLLHQSLFLQQQFVSLFVEDCIVLDFLQPDWWGQLGHLLVIRWQSWKVEIIGKNLASGFVLGDRRRGWRHWWGGWDGWHHWRHLGGRGMCKKN